MAERRLATARTKKVCHFDPSLFARWFAKMRFYNHTAIYVHK